MSDRHVSISNNQILPGYKTLGLLVLGLLFMPLLPLVVPANATTVSDLDDTEFQLFLTPGAPKLPADRNSYHAMIQLQVSGNNNPIEAPQDMEITLLSSDPSVMAVPNNKITLVQGQSMVKVELVTTDKAGVAAITAQAVGVKSSSASISTYRMDSLEPTRLAIYSAPLSFVPDSQHTGMIYIQVLNSQSLPTSSRNDISVDISSSDPTVGRVPSNAVIPTGSSGISVVFTPQKKVGLTTIKASALGLAPGELLVDVAGQVASKLVVEFAPEIVPAVNYYDAMMTVQLADESGQPVKASRVTKVLLKSSDTSIIEVPSYVEIAPGKSYTTTFVESKGNVGTATITASATGFESGINSIEAIPVSTVGTNDPKQLRLFSIPGVLPPDNSEHQSLIVAFQDMTGHPYRQTGYLYQRIALSSSNTQIGEITSTAFAAKETYAIAKFKTKHVIGQTQITASLDGYQPTQMTLEVAGSGPASIMVTQIPGIIEANNFESRSLVVGIVDHEGRPVTSQEDTVVYLSSSDPEITRIQASVIIPAGKTHVTALAQTTLRAGTTTISGSADGLGAGATMFRTVGFTGSVSEYHLGLYAIPTLSADGREYEAVVVQLQDSAGLPVLAKSNVTVSLSSGSPIAGTIQKNVVIPKGSSIMTALFKTSLMKDESFKITASSEGFATIETEMNVATQPLSVYRTSELPSRLDFGSEIPISVEVYSGSLPVSDAIVSITGLSATESIVITDENGHAEGVYRATQPGSNTIVVKASKPGYSEEETVTRVNLLQTIDVTITAETQGGAIAPAELKVMLPSSKKMQTTIPGSPLFYEDASWGEYTLEAPLQVSRPDAVYQFVQWSDGSTENPHKWKVIDDSKLSAIYKASYLLEVRDVNGAAVGGGYFEEGNTANIGTTKATVPGIMTDKEFAGWSGSITSASPSAEVVMDGPKVVEAQWKDNYVKVALIGAAIGGAGFFYYWKIFKPKRELQAEQKAPDLDWYKS